jgi:hypothetical protein
VPAPPAQALIEAHIKGPGLIGPRLSQPDATQKFDEAANSQAGPVSVLLADSWIEVVELSFRWATHSDTDWFVGTQTTRQQLEDAYGQSPNLRVLVAIDLDELRNLTLAWANQG